MTTTKHIVATGKMSNLVGMWAFIWQDNKIKNRVFVFGKANDDYYIIQAISALTGEPNVCKLIQLKDMINWTFYHTKEIADEAYEYWCENKINLYKFDINN